MLRCAIGLISWHGSWCPGRTMWVGPARFPALEKSSWDDIRHRADGPWALDPEWQAEGDVGWILDITRITWLGHKLGDKIWDQIGSDWSQMGQNRDFFRSYFSTLGSIEPNVLKSDLKKSRICPFWSQSEPILSQTYHLWFCVWVREQTQQICLY